MTNKVFHRQFCLISPAFLFPGQSSSSDGVLPIAKESLTTIVRLFVGPRTANESVKRTIKIEKIKKFFPCETCSDGVVVDDDDDDNDGDPMLIDVKI